MSLYGADEALSDDEVFIGKFTMKELKKHILWESHPHLCTVSVDNSPKQSNSLDTSVKILQVHSQPNLRSGKYNYDPNSSDMSHSEWDVGDESFVRMENMVAKLCMSPNNAHKAEELNNTLEVIDFILNNPPSSDTNYQAMNNIELKTEKTEYMTTNTMMPPDNINDEELENAHTILKLEPKIQPLQLFTSPQKACKTEKPDSPQCPQNTPIKTNNKAGGHTEGYLTPRNTQTKTIFKTPIFKTPGQPLSVKKPFCTPLKKTPNKSQAYQHIRSPVASYIRSGPAVPFVRDIHPKKSICSSIPKLKHPIQVKQSNKENIVLPSTAYKSAIKTQVIDVPDEKKYPQCEWAQKIMTSVPRAVVIKHGHREVNLAKKKLMSQTDNSFDDLSFHQAEVSVCVQKSAFNSNTNV